MAAELSLSRWPPERPSPPLAGGANRPLNADSEIKVASAVDATHLPEIGGEGGCLTDAAVSM